MAESRELRIVLLGKIGAGKSATGNTILGRQAFKENLSSVSVTKTCEKYDVVRNGRRVTVVDTPGFGSPSLSQRHSEIEKCLTLFDPAPGPHVFLVVIKLGRFTAEQRDAVKWIQKNFGEEAEKYTMLLFSRGDQLKKSIEEFVGSNNELRELIERFEYHVFNNKDRSDSTQVTKLLAKIEEMVQSNTVEFYSYKMYQEVQKQKKKKMMLYITGVIGLVCFAVLAYNALQEL